MKEGMNVEIINNNCPVAVINKDQIINGVQDILDIIASAQYNYDCTGLVAHKESLGEEFFDLKTGYAGKILQKFSNYNMKIAIIGDFSEYRSNSLHEFIYECNNGIRVFFKDSIESGLAAHELPFSCVF